MQLATLLIGLISATALWSGVQALNQPARTSYDRARVTYGGALLPPLRVQPNLVPGVLVVDIGIAQRILKMPDQLSRLLIGKAAGRRAPLESVAGDRLRLIEPDAETDLERLTDSFHLNLTAFGLLSFFVGLFIVNSAIGLAFEQRLPVLRTLRA